MPEDRQFIGFDAYQKAMDCLKPGDIAIFATPLAFRWVHFTYAIEKGLNVFMEKPLTADGPTSRRMLKLAEEAGGEEPQGGRGPDVAPQPGRSRNWHKRIQDGEIGDIIADARLPHARAGRARSPRAEMARRPERAALPDPASSTASSGPAAAASATSTSTSSTTAAG